MSKDKYPNLNRMWKIVAKNRGLDTRPLDMEATCVGVPREELQKIEKALGKSDGKLDLEKWPWLVRVMTVMHTVK